MMTFTKEILNAKLPFLCSGSDIFFFGNAKLREIKGYSFRKNNFQKHILQQKFMYVFSIV